LDELLDQVPPRSLMLLLIAVPLLVAAASYLYVFKKPLANYRTTLGTLVQLESETRSQQPLDQQIESTAQVLEELEGKLLGDGPRLPANQMVAWIIGRLDVIANTHGVQLVSVEPGGGSAVLMFDEIPFHVEVSGSYFDLFDWLGDAESALGPMVIKQFTLERVGNEERLRMRLTMVSYRHRENDR
jgi:Tfp pilus assembly protein PilO